jgi:hypothetical protein
LQSPLREEEGVKGLRIRLAVGIAVIIAGGSAAVAVATDRFGFKTDLSGYQEVPAVSTDGGGTFRAAVNRRSQEIRWELTFGRLTSPALQAHIHFGQLSVNGGISVFLCTNLGNGPAGTQACPPQGGRISGTIKPADVIGPGDQGIAPGEFAELVRAIQAGATYANVHTDKFKGGEIRGQIPGQHD